MSDRQGLVPIPGAVLLAENYLTGKSDIPSLPNCARCGWRTTLCQCAGAEPTFPTGTSQEVLDYHLFLKAFQTWMEETFGWKRPGGVV